MSKYEIMYTPVLETVCGISLDGQCVLHVVDSLCTKANIQDIVDRLNKADLERFRKKVENATMDHCTCGGSGPGETDCVACAIYHDVFTRTTLKVGE